MRGQNLSTIYFENKNMLNGCLLVALKNNATDLFTGPKYELQDEYNIAGRFSDYG